MIDSRTRMRCQKRHGFTLLELMVVSVLMGLMAMITAQFWRFYAVERKDLTTRVRASQELSLALEGLTSDIGAAVGASILEDDRVLLCKDGGPTPNGEADWGSPDALVEYVLTDGKLYREDQSTGTRIVVAEGVTTFFVQETGDNLYTITVVVQFDDLERQATINWSLEL